MSYLIIRPVLNHYYTGEDRSQDYGNLHELIGTCGNILIHEHGLYLLHSNYSFDDTYRIIEESLPRAEDQLIVAETQTEYNRGSGGFEPIVRQRLF